jgi:hypothetical protein
MAERSVLLELHNATNVKGVEADGSLTTIASGLANATGLPSAP